MEIPGNHAKPEVPVSPESLSSRPYHELVDFAHSNPIFAETVFSTAAPKEFWSPDLDRLLSEMQKAKEAGDNNAYHSIYTNIVDELFRNSGIFTLERMIDDLEAKEKIRRYGFNPAAEFGSGVVSENPSINDLFQKITRNSFRPDWMSLDTSILPLLYHQKRVATELLLETLKEKVGIFGKDGTKDPLLYWIPLITLISGTKVVHEGGGYAGLAAAGALYEKAYAYAPDAAMKTLFEIEYFARIGPPLTKKRLEELKRTINEAIFELKKRDAPASDIQRYYSVYGRLWFFRYLDEVGSFNPSRSAVLRLEDELREIWGERKGRVSYEEAGVYADCANLVASVWTDRGGIIEQTFWRDGLSAAKLEIARIASVEKEILAIVHPVMRTLSNGELAEQVAELRWKTHVEAYFRCGLPKTALMNYKNELAVFTQTRSQRRRIEDLVKKYPWLRDKYGEISLNEVGERGAEAVDISKAVFVGGKEAAREIGLPAALAIAGSYFHPLASMGGALGGKFINRVINLNSSDAEEVLSEVLATGIPIVDEILSDELKEQDYTDWLTIGAGALATFKFSRFFLSMGRASAQASFDFVRSGGIGRTLSAVKNSAAGVYVNTPQSFSQLVSGIAASVKEGVAGLKYIAPAWSIRLGANPSVYDYIYYIWQTYGVGIRIGGGAFLLYNDKAGDGKFDTIQGVFGASVILNEVYGRVVWGLDTAGSLLSFLWGFGFEVGVQWYQGVPVIRPRMDYTLVGLLMSMTARGINKLYALGRAEASVSPVAKRIAKFCEKYNVIIPQSVVGRSEIKARHGMLRGQSLLVGKPMRAPTRMMPDGKVLGLKITERSNGGTHYVIEVFRKMTDGAGFPVVVKETILERRASAIGRWFFRTINFKLKDSWLYRSLDAAIFRFFTARPAWWKTLGEVTSTKSRPIFNIRGSISNLEVLPAIGAATALYGYLQGADPVFNGLFRASTYGVAYFWQHKLGHLLKIDSSLGVSAGYFISIPATLLSLPAFFPTAINHVPAVEREKTGYLAMLEEGNFEEADKILKSSLTSINISHHIPLLGRLNPLGTVEDSNYRIEEKGAIAYWRIMEKRLYGDVAFRLVDKVVHDIVTSFYNGELTDDPVILRLHILEMAFVKRLMKDTSHQGLSAYARGFEEILDPILGSIPLIKDEDDLSLFVRGLNSNKFLSLKGT